MTSSASTETINPSSCDRAIVGIIASAGGIPSLIALLRALPKDFPFPIVIAQHLSLDAPSILPLVLNWHAAVDARWAVNGEAVRGGVIYLVPAGHDLEVVNGQFVVAPLAPYASAWLRAPDVLLLSLAKTCGAKAVGIVLSGMLPVGISGLRAIRAAGGLVFAQSEISSPYFDMPAAAADFGKADLIFSPARIAEALSVLADQSLAAA